MSRVRTPDRAVKVTVFGDKEALGTVIFFALKALEVLGLTKKNILKIAARLVAGEINSLFWRFQIYIIILI